MKMASGGIKGISALLVAWFTYIDKTFTPLFWVLLALVALDMFLNVHKEGQQFIKIGSMAISLGVPSYVGANLSNPDLGKYLVAIMCLVYLQLVVPVLVQKISALKVSKDPVKNAVDIATMNAVLAKLDAIEKQQAEKTLKEVGAPTVIQDTPSLATQEAPTEAAGGK